MFKKLAINENLIQLRPSLGKMGQVFKNHRDMGECYWNAKHYQRKASAKNEKMGYELVGPKKIKTDRSKLLVEAKTLYNLTMDLNKNKENESLKIVNVLIMDLEGHILSVKLVDDYLYVTESIQSFTLLSTVPRLKNNRKATIKYFWDYKQHVLDTAYVAKQTLIDEEKNKKSMKRKLEEDDNNEGATPPLPKNTKLAPVWRFKSKSER